MALESILATFMVLKFESYIRTDMWAEQNDIDSRVPPREFLMQDISEGDPNHSCITQFSCCLPVLGAHFDIHCFILFYLLGIILDKVNSTQF
jgi:hypothetical protein